MDFNQLEEKYPDDAAIVRHMEKEYKISSAFADLAKHLAFQDLLSQLDARLETINRKLLQASTEEETRKELFYERGILLWFCSMFNDAEKQVAKMEDFIKSKL
jgi:hypothetical protein